MRRIVVLIMLAAILGAASPALAAPEKVLPNGSHQVTLSIPEMECSMCTRSVRNEVKHVPGVTVVRIDPLRRLAVVTFDPSRVDLKRIQEAVHHAGFACKPVDSGGSRP